MSKSEKQKRKELKKAYKKADVSKDPFMRRLHEAKTFKTFSPANAAETPDHELDWRVVVVVLNRIGRQYDREEEIVSQFSGPVKAIFATWMVESEVMNGGFRQFFCNQQPYLAKLAVDGYQYLGSPEQMRAVQIAIVRHSRGLDNFDEQDQIINDMWRSSVDNKTQRIRERPELFSIRDEP